MLPTTALSLLLISSAFAISPTQNVVTVSVPAGLEFYAICKAARIPCAIELDLAAAGEPGARGAFREHGATVSEAMNRAIRRYPGHRWRFRQGILYVTPNAPDPSTPLDRALGRSSFRESLETLRAEFGPPAGFCVSPHRADPGPAPALTSQAFSLDGATPRAVLNAFLFRQGDAGWVAVRAPSSGGRFVYCLDVMSYGTGPR
ncbi:MAG: hypothetical protein KGL74_00825 [Elusimicrobia bacterium]|nr:hypothetical protein [Elusimicrobiota bacterium]